MNSSNSLPGNRAFTLTEIVIAVGIFSMVILLITSFTSFMRRSSKRVDSTGRASMELNRLFQYISRDLRTASEISMPMVGMRSDRLDFTSADGEAIRYAFNKAERPVREILSSHELKVLTAPLISMTFSRYQPQILIVEATMGKGKRPMTLLTSVYLRNKR